MDGARTPCNHQKVSKNSSCWRQVLQLSALMMHYILQKNILVMWNIFLKKFCKKLVKIVQSLEFGRFSYIVQWQDSSLAFFHLSYDILEEWSVLSFPALGEDHRRKPKQIRVWEHSSRQTDTQTVLLTATKNRCKCTLCVGIVQNFKLKFNYEMPVGGYWNKKKQLLYRSAEYWIFWKHSFWRQWKVCVIFESCKVTYELLAKGHIMPSLVFSWSCLFENGTLYNIWNFIWSYMYMYQTTSMK